MKTLRPLLMAALLGAPSLALAASFQFQVLGASEDWLVIREDVRMEGEIASACTYPGVDPAEYLGSRVHFVRLSDAAQRGRLVLFEPQGEPLPLFTPTPGPSPCTSPAEAAQRWAEIVARAGELGVRIVPGKPPKPATLGVPVPAKSCVLTGGGATHRDCRRELEHTLAGRPIRIAVQLIAIPEAPELKSCQFTGLRLGAAIQVAGGDFGELGASAPGGFATHYDCRSQQLDALRVYQLGGALIILGSFKGTSIADHREYPFFVVARPGPG